MGCKHMVGGELQSWQSGQLTVKPSIGDCGRSWALVVREYPGLLLDDLHVAVEGDVPPILAVHAGWADRIGRQVRAT